MQASFSKNVNQAYHLSHQSSWYLYEVDTTKERRSCKPAHVPNDTTTQCYKCATPVKPGLDCLVKHLHHRALPIRIKSVKAK